MRILSPSDIRDQFPLTSSAFIQNARRRAAEIVQRKHNKIALLVGPCSIHDPALAFDYALRLKKISLQTENLFIVMRLFLEKPRTQKGWKGLLYDPTLDGTHNVNLGLQLSRELLIKINKLELPCVTELLDPLTLPYLEDLICWGMIGARTCASQPHRQFASGLAFPVGFKNGVHGELDVAIHGILSARDSHTHLSIDDEGYICSKTTPGNPLSHLVLRGSNTTTNYDAQSLSHASAMLAMNHITPSILVDCSHGNSEKNHKLQAKAFKSVIHQILEGNQAICGLMLESHLNAGKQPLKSPLSYGVSITDSCIGWEETEELILWADKQLSPTSISSVQK